MGNAVWQSAATSTDQNLAAAWCTPFAETGGSATRLSATGAWGSAVASDKLAVVHNVKSVCPIPDLCTLRFADLALSKKVGRHWCRPILSAWPVADRLDVVSIGIKYKRAAIIRVIVRPHVGRTVILAARGQRRAVERVNRGPVFRSDRNVQRLVHHSLATDPKIRLAIAAETGSRHSSCLHGHLLD